MVSDVTHYDDALALKGAIERLMGADEWYRLKDTSSLATWRKSLRRALKISETAIIGTVKVADSAWFNDAGKIISDADNLLKGAKTIVELLSAFSACYLLLSFHQLGLAPNVTGKRIKTRTVPAQWDMSAFRSVQYVQSKNQILRLEWRNDKRPIEVKSLDAKYRAIRFASS